MAIRFLAIFLSFGENFDRLTRLQTNATFSTGINHVYNTITVVTEERLELILRPLFS